MDKSTRTDLLAHNFAYKKNDTFAFVYLALRFMANNTLSSVL